MVQRISVAAKFFSIHSQEHRKESHTSPENANRCTICRGLYSDKDTLQKHIAMHEGKDRLQCVECNTIFARKCGLIRHMPFHTGEVVRLIVKEIKWKRNFHYTLSFLAILRFIYAICVEWNSSMSRRFADICYITVTFVITVVRCAIKCL